ncbi:hypothetical protein [Catenulispora sp. GAS73]|uniref:hypothetical protein n=1 Tax=Catenulispora sp. GAS73 TaxID=3156269 RepID=UPI003517EB8E
MKSLINPRTIARLAAACVAITALAPVTAAASTHDLCDGHKWSLFGCRHDLGQHRVHLPEEALPGSGLAVGTAARGPDGTDARE